MKLISFVLAGFLMLAINASAQQETLTNKTVVDLVKSGLDKDIIIDKIEGSAGKFDLSTAGLVMLKKDGVPSEIIKAMMSKASGKTPVQATGNNTTAPVTHTPARQVPQLEVVNVPQFYNSKTNTVTPLEKNTGDIKGKLTLKDMMNPFGSGDILLIIDGDKSSVRLSATDSLGFLVNSDKGTPDAFRFYRMTVKKGKRQTVYEKDLDARNKAKNIISFTYKKLKDDIYLIIPGEKLTPGEYCFLFDYSVATYNGKQGDVYAFGVNE